MRRVDDLQSGLVSGEGPPAAFADQINRITGFLRRQYRIVIICFLLTLPLGVLYYLLAPRTYTASVTMLLESHKSILPESMTDNGPRDAGWVENQLGVLKSQSVAAYLVKQLRLADDPQFLRSGNGPIDRLLAFMGLGSESRTDAERAGAATGAVMGGLDIRRLNASYMVQINFNARTSEHAVKIANAMVDAYIYDQLNAKYQATRRAGDWLQERLQTLREQAATAERAVIEFKAKNNIVKTGGALMNEKQLSEMSAQLATARSQAADLQARLDRIAVVRNAYQNERSDTTMDESVSEEMSSAIIGRLRSQYLDFVNREADYSLRYGKDHTAVVNLRNQIRDLRKSIRDELGRIQESIKSELEIAKKRQEEAEKGLASLVSQSTQTNQAQVTLFSLEASAQSYRKLYDNFLQLHTETVQQQSIPITDARVLSPASISKTSPQLLPVCLLTILAGGMVGVGFGAFRELMDRGIRTREQVQSIFDTECLLVPMLTKPDVDITRDRPRNRLMLPKPFARQEHTRKHFSSKAWRSIVNEPSSPWAEAVRSLKFVLDLKEGGQSSNIIGLTSCLPNEGKSTIAAALAATVALSGARVLLVDCDLRNPSLSRIFAPRAKIGFLEFADGKVSLAEAVLQDHVTKMDFLPTTIDPRSPIRTDVFASSMTKSLFKSLQIEYDYVIVDLPPLAAGVDVRATLRHVDSYFLVVEWGCTKIDEVQYALRNTPGLQASIAGVVLNKVDMAAMKLYDGYSSNYYYGPPKSVN